MKKYSMAAVMVVLGIGSGVAQQVEIQSLSGNGQIVWTAPINSDCTVEWSGALTPAANWSRTWETLTDISSSNGTFTATVPMFYRVTCWTNGLFLRTPVGRMLTYAVTNAIGEAWTQRVSFIGQVLIPSMSNQYTMAISQNEFSGSEPQGMVSEWMGMIRATDAAMYGFAGPGVEGLDWQKASVGSVWTNDTTVLRVEAVESVTVPAGTFPSCIKFKKWNIGDPPEDVWYEWVAPGFFLVKWVDYNSAPAAEPIVYELESWTDQ